MPFGRWYPLCEAADRTPSRPGVLQVRLRVGLRPYPRGRSAMVHYEAADNLRLAAAALFARHPQADWLCRHAATGGGEESRQLYQELLISFRRRFGASPSPSL